MKSKRGFQVNSRERDRERKYLVIRIFFLLHSLVWFGLDRKTKLNQSSNQKPKAESDSGKFNLNSA